MTTIAYKHGILAADTLCTSGMDLRIGNITKIWMGKSYMGGLSGTISDGALFKKWLVKDNLKGDIPDFSKDLKAVIIGRDHNIYYMAIAGILVPVDATCAASGTGEEVALGAMHAGASAEQAVEISIGLDIYSGGDVHILQFGK